MFHGLVRNGKQLGENWENLGKSRIEKQMGVTWQETEGKLENWGLHMQRDGYWV